MKNKKEILFRFANLTIRLLAMGAKFLLVILITKYLTIEELGSYSIFFTTVTLLTFLLGFDFYTYTARELIYYKDKQFSHIVNQNIFFIISYVFVLPLVFLIFQFNYISSKYIFYFYFLLILEHLSQEIYRLLTSLSKPIIANILLLIRSGVWVYMLGILWFYDVISEKTLNIIYICWGISALISVVLGFGYVLVMYKESISKFEIDWKWILKGIKMSTSFFIGTLAYKVIEFSDRYILDLFMTKTDVGVYTFYANISNALQTIIFTMVIMIYYPRVITVYKNNPEIIGNVIKSFYKEVIIYSLVFSVLISAVTYPILFFLDKIELYEYVYVLWFLLVSVFILNLSFVAHYLMYVKHKDNLIRNITILGAVLNIAINFILIPILGILGAAISTMISYMLIFLMKEKYK